MGRQMMKLAATLGAALLLAAGAMSCKSTLAVSDDGQTEARDTKLSRVVLEVPTII